MLCESRPCDPENFFDFAGAESSGLALPSMAWPFEYGYCFWVWVRVDTFYPKTDPRQMHLFTFMNQAGHGVDLFFQGAELRLQITDGKGKGQVTIAVLSAFPAPGGDDAAVSRHAQPPPPLVFQEKRW